MKKLNLTFLVLLFFVIQTDLQAQSLLPTKWKFTTGDNPAWASPSFDDTNWKEIKVATIWEEQGYVGYDGFAWYRTSVIIPSSLKSASVKYGGLSLKLGKIDDVDETFWNGKVIGSSGTFPPNSNSAYDKYRKYIIPTNSIRWNQTNVIAIRVFDGGGGGGLSSEPVTLGVNGLSDLIVMDAGFKQTDHILTNSKEIEVPISIKNNFKADFAGKISLSVVSDFKKDVYTKTEAIKVKGNSSVNYKFKINELEPGFYNATARLDGKEFSKTFVFSFGVSPEKIVSPTDIPSDMDAYWNRAKKELAAVDPQFKLIKNDSLSTAKKNVYLLEMRSLGNVLIRGWYVVPVKTIKSPAILHVQGYSSVMSPEMNTDDDFVTLSLNIRGHGNSRDNVNPGFPGYILHSITDKEQYIYRGAYMDCIRAMDFLYARPEVDTTRIAVEGGSQGGALTFATAALDNKRVAICIPQIPFLSDFPDYFKIAKWPGEEFVALVKNNPAITWEKMFNTLSYIDIKNLAPRIKAPLLMSVGLIDDICPPHINFAAYNQVTSPKEYRVYPQTGHAVPSEFDHLKWQWIKEHFNMK